MENFTGVVRKGLLLLIFILMLLFLATTTKLENEQELDEVDAMAGAAPSISQNEKDCGPLVLNKHGIYVCNLE